jgi:flagellar assembly protein FliH
VAQYQKYMFDNFIIKTPQDEFDDENVTVDAETTEDADATAVVDDFEPQTVEENVPEEDTPLPDEQLEQPIEAPVEKFSREELDSAVKLAEEKGYEQGFQASANDMIAKQNILLEELNNRLMAIFAAIDEQKTVLEADALKFALSLFHKMLPTLEKTAAEDEVRKFLSDNFANFAAQDNLSFSFNPETLPLIAKDLGRLAEQNDYEGKIAVHKDDGLGLSDCRVEWKNGGVERSVAKSLTKVENLIEGNIQERDNG